MSRLSLPRILCVDDDPLVLQGLRRTLRSRFAITTAAGALAGLGALEAEGPFAVIMSDLRMPETDGVALLRRARELVPDTVRVLLTGQADLQAAVNVVNEGHVFRFLLKPCPPDRLVAGLEAAVEQHRVITAARDLSRTKDELVSVVSHELRTPLASLVGFAELMLSRDFAEAQRRQFLTVMHQEGRRLTALINDFLDLQRMEGGRQTVAPRPIDLRPLVERAVAVAGEDADCPISVEVADDLPPVLADPDRIQQVLTNLLSNARKYSPAGGPIRVVVRPTDDVVRIAIRDRGLGIPPEALPKIFDKFYRVDNSDRRTISGTGLGLAIVRHIVEAHGGRAWAESAGLGHGACLSFTLPIAESDIASGEVWVIDDDPTFARLLTADLASHGYATVWLPGAEAAIKRLAGGLPSAVAFDPFLFGIGSEVFLRCLRANHGAEVPTVAVAVKDLTSDDREELAELGVAAVICKDADGAVETASVLAHLLAVGPVGSNGEAA